MKIFFLFLAVLTFFSSIAQPKILTHAVVTSKTSITLPDDMPAMQDGDGNRMVMINGMSGGDDTKTTIWYNGDKVKIVNDGGMGKSTIIINKAEKKTTTLIEMMGNKTGFVSTEEDEIQQRKRMDSMMGARRNSVTNISIDYFDDTKKIAGYECKKALIKTSHQNGKTDSMFVWFTPEIKMAEGYSFRSGGMMGGGGNMSGFDKLNGFPMKYEMKMRRGMIMSMEVTKIDTEKNISDNEFDIPKGFDIKPMSEMRGPGGGMQFRTGG
ncbi:hypothetical protein BH09BAC2_BH09BAC2_24110 [soil metagenome]